MHLAGWDKADGDDPQAGRCLLAVPGAAPPVLLEQVPDSHHLRWAGSGHAPALCLLLAPMARCCFFTTDNYHVSKTPVKVGSRAPPPCWGRTSRRGSPARSTGCTVCLARVPWVLQLPEPGSGEQLEEAPWGCRLSSHAARPPSQHHGLCQHSVLAPSASPDFRPNQWLQLL